MKLWIVDHNYGAALVAAQTSQHAKDMADELGPVLGVYPYKGTLMLDLERIERQENGERFRVLEAAIVGGTDELIGAALDEYNITLTREDYEKAGPSGHRKTVVK